MAADIEVGLDDQHGRAAFSRGNRCRQAYAAGADYDDVRFAFPGRLDVGLQVSVPRQLSDSPRGRRPILVFGCDAALCWQRLLTEAILHRSDSLAEGDDSPDRMRAGFLLNMMQSSFG
jgi:hypothetical protein